MSHNRNLKTDNKHRHGTFYTSYSTTFMPSFAKGSHLSQENRIQISLDEHSMSNAFHSSSNESLTCLLYYTDWMTVPQRRQLVASLSLQRQRFDPRPAHATCGAQSGKETGSSPTTALQPSHHHHSINAPYSFIYHQHQISAKNSDISSITSQS